MAISRMSHQVMAGSAGEVGQPVQHVRGAGFHRPGSRQRLERHRPCREHCARARYARRAARRLRPAAAVAMSRSLGARSPIAALRNDLRDGPTSSGTAQRREFRQRRERGVAVFGPLGEPQPGIEHHRLALHSCGQSALEARTKLVPHFSAAPTRKWPPCTCPGNAPGHASG